MTGRVRSEICPYFSCIVAPPRLPVMYNPPCDLDGPNEL